MKSSTHSQGTIKSKSLMDLLGKKVELKKELIRLKKANKEPKKQEILTESIAQINSYLSNHRIQK